MSLTKQQALDLFHSDDLIGIGMEADAVRRRLHPEGTVTYIILRSGPAELGRWVEERRDVRADYRAIYGEEPPDPGAITLSIDSNDTHSRAESLIGPIRFSPS